MQSALKYLAALAVVLTQACSEDTMPTAPALGDAAVIEEHGARFGGDRDVTVMTQNLYVGRRRGRRHHRPRHPRSRTTTSRPCWTPWPPSSAPTFRRGPAPSRLQVKKRRPR